MSRDEAQEILECQQDFAYLKMKINLKSDTELQPWGFDRDNGQGAVQQC